MDMDVFKLYGEVLRDEQSFFNVTSDGLKRSFIMLKRTYNRRALKNCKTYVNYHLPPDRCAYLYKYGPCHTQLVSVYFRKFLENARNVYSTLEKKNELKICSLGGGPGTDVVGMFSVLASYEDLWAKLHEVTVLDVCGGWRNSFKRVMKKLAEIYPLQENFLSNLVSADLMDTLSAPALKAIEEADILCMVKFVSTVMSHPSAESAFKELAGHMKPGAAVIFIDNLDKRISKPFKKYFSESGFKCVFRDVCDNFEVQGSYRLRFKDVEGSETMERANVYVLGYIKGFFPELTIIHEGNLETPVESSLYSSNSEDDNCPESDDNGSNSDSVNCCPIKTNVDFKCDDFISNAHGEQLYSDQGTRTVLSSCLMKSGVSNSSINGNELSHGAGKEKRYADQCTQMVENSDGVSRCLGKDAIFDNLSSNKFPCDTEETKLYTDRCIQTADFLCDQSSCCVNYARLEGLGCQLSRIALRLSRIEFLIENIAIGCNKEFCSGTSCSDHHIHRSSFSDKCHCCFNHC